MGRLAGGRDQDHADLFCKQGWSETGGGGRLISTPDAPQLSASSKRTMLLASLGGALEYYDCIVYGIFAAGIARTGRDVRRRCCRGLSIRARDQ
jgi:hypothetical protein